ncbi:MAG: hypothetical protein ACI9XP_001006 [Lentimonas sp.]|jgi:hypothetical protein
MDTTEIIGYIGSFLILLSFSMKKMKTLRYVNLIGCGVFISYGVLIDSIPIIITNAAIVLVNIYYLFLAKDRV